jgi:purine nucleoside permease
MVVVANFENGADTGDKPGEYQFWVEREHLDEILKVRGVDLKRVMVLRTASNPSGPPPGVDALASIGDEAPGQVAAYEANYRVGAPVVHELIGNWSHYRDVVPQSAFK